MAPSAMAALQEVMSSQQLLKKLGKTMKRISIKPSVVSIQLCCSVWLFVVARRALPAHDGPERGDVPGWVMITLMSAILVAGLLAIATPALTDLFNQAMSKVGK